MGIDSRGCNLVSVLLLFTAGLVLIIKGGDYSLMRQRGLRAPVFRNSLLVRQLLVLQSTLPEMLVSVFAALEGNADIAVGNAVGSVTGKHGFDYVSVVGRLNAR